MLCDIIFYIKMSNFPIYFNINIYLRPNRNDSYSNITNIM